MADNFEKSVMEDLARAKTLSKESAAGAGLKEEAPDFAPSALRIGKKAIGQKELLDAQTQMDGIVRKIAETATGLDDAERNKLQLGLSRKMRQAQLEIMKRGAAMQKRAALLGLDQQKQAQMAEALGGMGFNIGQQLFSSFENKAAIDKELDKL